MKKNFLINQFLFWRRNGSSSVYSVALLEEYKMLD